MSEATDFQTKAPVVKGLPKGAVVDGDRVLFRYTRQTYAREEFDEDFTDHQIFERVERTEEDEIGKVEEGKFVPNDYYTKWHPTADIKERPAHRWRVECKRQDAFERRNGWEQAWNSTRLPESAAEFNFVNGRFDDYLRVGLPIYAADYLWNNGVAENLVCGTFKDAERAADLMNLVIGAWPQAVVETYEKPLQADLFGYRPQDHRGIGADAFKDGLAPLLKRVEKDTGFLTRFAESRLGTAQARDTMVVVFAEKCVALKVAVDSAEILGVHAYKKPETWEPRHVLGLLKNLQADDDTPVYFYEKTLTDAEFRKLDHDGRLNIFSEVGWTSPLVEGLKAEFSQPIVFYTSMPRYRHIAVLSVPGGFGKAMYLCRYALMHELGRGHRTRKTIYKACINYMLDWKADHNTPCPEAVVPYIKFAQNGAPEIDNAAYLKADEDACWCAVAYCGQNYPADEFVVRLRKTADFLREPLQLMYEALAHLADNTSSAPKATALTAALGAVIAGKFLRQCRIYAYAEYCNHHDWCDDYVSTMWHSYEGTTVEEPDYGGFAHVSPNFNLDELEDPGFVMGTTAPLFDSEIEVFEKLSLTKLKSTAARFSAKVDNKTPPAAIFNEALLKKPVEHRFSDDVEQLGRSFSTKPLCDYVRRLYLTVEKHYGKTPKTVKDRLMKSGVDATLAAAVAERLALYRKVCADIDKKLEGWKRPADSVYTQRVGSLAWAFHHGELPGSVEIITALASLLVSIPDASDEEKDLAKDAFSRVGAGDLLKTAFPDTPIYGC